MFRDFREETTDLERHDKAHKLLTETVIPYIHTAGQMNRQRSIRDLEVNLMSSLIQVSTKIILYSGIRRLPKQWVVCLIAMGDFFNTHLYSVTILSISFNFVFPLFMWRLLELSNGFHLN